MGRVNIRRQTGKITIQQAYDDEERQRSLASIRRAREKEKKSLASVDKSEENISKPIVREVKIPEVITVQELANRMASRVAEVIKVLIKNEIDRTNINVRPKPVIKLANRCSDLMSLTVRGILYSLDIRSIF